MTTIIIGFCGGIAFMAGVFCTLFFINLPKKNPIQTKIEKYWEDSIEKHRIQLSLLERIAYALENGRDAKK